MIIFLLKIICFALTTLSSVISRVIFTTLAHLFILLVVAFRVPGQAIQGGLEQVGEAIKSCFEFLLELLMEAIGSLVSGVFDLIKEGVSGSAVVTGSVVGGLAEKTRTSLEGLFKDLPDVLEGASEMVSSVLSDLWNNYKDALRYVTENV